MTNTDYVNQLTIYAKSHRKDGRPYLAEALHPDTGSFEGHDGYNHSEHYFHSGYCDLVITGLVGLVPRADDNLEIKPLAPADWDYFALDDVTYRGHRISIVWDKRGERYQLGQGMHVLVDGTVLHHSVNLQPVLLDKAVPATASITDSSPRPQLVNFAVNNDGHYYPRITASYTSEGTSVAKLHDGNYWYLLHPPNRWTSQGSPSDADWIEVDLGVERSIQTIKLYMLDDAELKDSPIRAPEKISVKSWNGSAWQPAQPSATTEPVKGHRPHTIAVNGLKTNKLRVEFTHAGSKRTGLTEIEVWGESQLPLPPVPPPAGNLAYNDGSKPFPRATASHHDRFGGVPKSAIDGITNFLPTPTNRWTSYESKTGTDWLEIDFGGAKEFRRVELAIYDDRGGVQKPQSYELETWDGQAWRPIDDVRKSPEKPAGSQWNSASFKPVTSSKLRIVFTNAGQARSGVTEVMIWND